MQFDLESVIKEPYTKKTSGIRVLKLTWGFMVLGVWAYVSIHTGVMVAIPDSVTTTLLGILGIGAVTRFAERPTEPKTST